ncbi:MAG: hypothetical protein LBL07_18290, partial [Tannerella sp.]|nr:hypothetical protein [Tannerella sp.]
LLLNINTLAISYASKHPETGLILFKILVFKREKLQLGLMINFLSFSLNFILLFSKLINRYILTAMPPASQIGLQCHSASSSKSRSK